MWGENKLLDYLYTNKNNNDSNNKQQYYYEIC
jgi:hypothetical protein